MKKLYILLSLFISITASAQYTFTVYNPSNSGVASYFIGDIKVDANGLLWMATYEGVSTFNGTTFTNYTTANSGIASNAIIKIEIDGLGKKWMASQNNGIILRNGTTWTNYTTANSGLPNNAINDIAVDGLNNLWIATAAGLTKFNGTTWTTYTSLPNLNSIATDSSNGVWVVNNFGVLYKFNGTDFNTIYQGGTNKILKIANNTIYCDSGDGLMTITTSGAYIGTQYQSTSCLSGYQFNALDVDSNNKVWIGFGSTGLQNFTDCTSYTVANSDLPMDDIRALKTLSSGTIWVGTSQGGLVKMTPGGTIGCWKQISSGQQFTVAIKSDGSLWSWGANAFGQLGYAGSNNNQPSQIGTATNWKSISCGVAHTLAIKTDGTLWAWGNNFYGYLGDGTTVAKNTPVQIGNATNWKSVCAGYTHSFGIKNDGTLWAWGYNQYGQLGDGTTTNRSLPTQIGTATNWQSVGAGNSHSMGIKTNGTLWTWGRNDKGQLGDGTAVNKTTPTQIGTATNWQYIDGGISYTAALKTDGTIWTWGENTYGQLGQNDLVNRSTPTQVGTPNDTWEFVSAGGYHIVASKNYDAIFAWGRNDSGQLGNGTTTNTLIPTFLIDGIEWNAVSAGFDFSSAMSTNGDVHTWGNNSLGQLGNGTNTNNSDAYNSVTCPTTLDVTDFTRLANNVRTYPNPVKNILNISFEQEISTVSIFNLIGQEVIAKSLNSKEGTIDVSNLASGTYLVKVTSDGEVKTTKIIKE